MIEFFLTVGCAMISISSALGTLALWLRNADPKNIISLILTDEDGNVSVQYPFLSRRG